MSAALDKDMAVADTRWGMQEVRKTVTVLFADVVASTELAERLDPEALRRIMSRYFAEMSEVVERHGGTVEKFIGDEVMAVFGVPSVHEDDALRAVRAAAAMRRRLQGLNEELAAWGPRLEIRVGINTGQVVAGDPSMGHGFVTGDVVNLAKRIEQAAGPGEILIGKATADIVRHAVTTSPVESFVAKGRRDEVAAERLEDVDLTSEAVPRRPDGPLVGRAAEVSALLAAYARAVDTRRPQLMTVLGLPGIGKSRLTRELLDGVEGEARVLVGRCVPYGEGITFWPVREILPDESFEGTREEIFWRVRKQLEAYAHERPLVVCFEDVHWAEATFLDLVQYLAGWIAEAPLLFLCLARPELVEKRPDWPRGEPDASAMTLGPLSERESDRLLELLGAPDAARDRIAEAADGNPLFVEQMTAMAADRGAEVIVPPSIQAVLAARLGHLDAEEATVVERAAVMGRDFPLEAALDLMPDELRPNAAAILLALVRKELIRPHSFGDEDGFRFRHALIRDAAYEGLSKQLRGDLHERHAAWLEGRSVAEVIVGYHLEQAVTLRGELGLHDERTRQLAIRAGELIGAAGRRAFRRDDIPAAVGLLERAAVLLAGQEARLAELLTELGTALGTAGRLTDADRVLEEALEAARRTHDRRSELRAHLLREQLRSFTAKTGPDAYARIAAEAIPELERLEDDLGLAKAWRLASSVDVSACRWTSRTDALERALVHARRVPEAPQERSSLIAVLAQALYYGPVPAAQAIARYREFLAEAENDPAVRAAVLAHLGGLLAMQGEVEEAHRLYDESAALHDELGLRFRRAVVSLVGAEIATLEGEPAAAERQLRKGYETLEAMGASGAGVAVAAVLADLLCREGSDEEAARFAELTGETADADDVLAHTLRRAVLGRLRARRGDVEAGLDLVQTAVEAASQTDFPTLQASALIASADVAALAGDGPAARRALEAARAAYESKGNEVAARHIADLSVLAT